MNPKEPIDPTKPIDLSRLPPGGHTSLTGRMQFQFDPPFPELPPDELECHVTVGGKALPGRHAFLITPKSNLET